jgi:hypothetical protein
VCLGLAWPSRSGSWEADFPPDRATPRFNLKLWLRLVEVANDPWPYSAWQTPSRVLKYVVVSGV